MPTPGRILRSLAAAGLLCGGVVWIAPAGNDVAWTASAPLPLVTKAPVWPAPPRHAVPRVTVAKPFKHKGHVGTAAPQPTPSPAQQPSGAGSKPSAAAETPQPSMPPAPSLGAQIASPGAAPPGAPAPQVEPPSATVAKPSAAPPPEVAAAPSGAPAPPSETTTESVAPSLLPGKEMLAAQPPEAAAPPSAPPPPMLERTAQPPEAEPAIKAESKEAPAIGGTANPPSESVTAPSGAAVPPGAPSPAAAEPKLAQDHAPMVAPPPKPPAPKAEPAPPPAGAAGPPPAQTPSFPLDWGLAAAIAAALALLIAGFAAIALRNRAGSAGQ